MVVVKGATKRFGPLAAVDGVDLEISPGASLAIFGANGSGKSTLLKMIAGLLRPTSGVVTVGDRPPLDNRARIGYLGHDPHLYPSLTSQENLRFFATLYGCKPEPARWLEEAGLASKTDVLAGSLSRGETQRLAIARALLHDPELVLLDEPFTGLDETSADKLIAALPRPGRTVIVVTHDTDRGRSMCERSVTMDSGRLR